MQSSPAVPLAPRGSTFSLPGDRYLSTAAELASCMVRIPP
jgi:hypothetical protein